MSNDFLQKVAKGTTQEVKEALRQDPSLASAVDPSGVSALLFATYNGRADIAQILIDSGLELNVFEAAATGQNTRLRELLAADNGLVNSYSPDGFFPLGLAAFFRQAEALQILLKAGADVNLAARNAMKVTALHAAAASGQTEAVRELLVRGADPNARQQSGYTALHQAAHSGNQEMAQVLLEHGADINQKTDDGKTALALALESNRPQTAAYLRQRGGD